MSTSTVQSRQSKDDEQLRNGKHTFVLVHGAWCGGWLWRHVAPRLQEQGHAVTTLTLTGLGERHHFGNGTATLATHIEDVVAHIEMEDLHVVTLVNQSYGGVVATGALARVMKARECGYRTYPAPATNQMNNEVGLFYRSIRVLPSFHHNTGTTASVSRQTARILSASDARRRRHHRLVCRGTPNHASPGRSRSGDRRRP
jgi:pimeloyl-ACP methyl ester carboxylesterase